MYKILSDPDRKALYDESGEIDDESDASLQQDTDWDSYWRALFKVPRPLKMCIGDLLISIYSVFFYF